MTRSLWVRHAAVLCSAHRGLSCRSWQKGLEEGERDVQNARPPSGPERSQSSWGSPHCPPSILARRSWRMGAFGDAASKWSSEIQQRLHEEFLGDRVRENVKTPPYFTSEPEMTTTEVQPRDFVAFATDGLWDCLTNEEVVGLVAFGWVVGSCQVRSRVRRRLVKNVWERDELPVKLEEDKTVMYRWWRAKKRFIDVDNNVAVHLVRNALGGAHKDLTSALLYMEPPRSRRYRCVLCLSWIVYNADEGYLLWGTILACKLCCFNDFALLMLRINGYPWDHSSRFVIHCGSHVLGGRGRDESQAAYLVEDHYYRSFVPRNLFSVAGHDCVFFPAGTYHPMAYLVLPLIEDGSTRS